MKVAFIGLGIMERATAEKNDGHDAEFPLQWLRKDLHLSSVTVCESSVPLPATNAIKEVYAAAAGLAEKDFSA